jgi:LPXTG-motif cell wall-anchored protein
VTLDNAVPALTATVRIGENISTVRFDKAKDCVPAAPTTPILPVTGADAGLMAGGAAGLIGVGTGLFLMARRRRISFTV